MSKYVKPVIAALTVVVYLLALRFIAPPMRPCFLIGPAVAGLVAWLSGRVAGLMVAMLLLPATRFIYSQFDISIGFSTYVTSPSYIALMAFAALGVGSARNYSNALKRRIEDYWKANENLQRKLSSVQEPGGLYNICSQCKSMKSENGNWESVNDFLQKNTKMQLTHCICPDCTESYQDQEIEFNPERF
ncbi:MAG: hypothetical protein JXR25_02140 [Pontiellaceae bacterium]|nr:hypothetical protein [Pontiellaceae bacterium]MBN2783600.1 hypothetical protein [Pontiellaceae bacterium]